MPKDKKKHTFHNVALFKEDHDMLRDLAEREQRSMARQLSVIIRKAVDELEQA
jgi:hypothetical protein